jgi:methylglyoxal synthase
MTKCDKRSKNFDTKAFDEKHAFKRVHKKAINYEAGQQKRKKLYNKYFEVTNEFEDALNGLTLLPPNVKDLEYEYGHKITKLLDVPNTLNLFTAEKLIKKLEVESRKIIEAIKQEEEECDLD